MFDDHEKRYMLNRIDRVDALTWLSTLAEVAIGIWIIWWMNWPMFGSFFVGVTMGVHLHRIVRIVFGAQTESDPSC